ncbi:MAG TPA: AMP-binding protein [Bryobacteraceae bacterium]|nr:AMP-binding protein [Bryobacteraceae bacterium]
MSGGWIWEPSREWILQTNVWRFMEKLGFTDREAFLRYSRENLEEFWDRMVREAEIDWFRGYDRVLDTSRGVEWSEWFLGGKLNIAWNCLDRHVASGRTACIREGEDGAVRTLTFAQLATEVNRLANALDALDLAKGDRVALIMPLIPEVITILYGCFKLGLIVVPIFAGFGATAISTRLEDSGARVVFTADHARRRGKLLPLKEKVDQALEKHTAVEKVVVFRYQGGNITWHGDRDIFWDEFVGGQSADREALPLDSEDRAFILYTSGTTGKPKGTIHTHAGCLAQMSKEIYLGFDHKPEDRFWWLSDIGWMMGPWTIIGNHNFGGTIFLYDGAPDYPGPDRLWQMIERHGITTFGISPTAIRLLMRAGLPKQPMPSLRLLGSTGEPWDDTSYLWFFENVGHGRCPIINISGGTEIAGSFLFPLPIQPLKPCSLGGPAPGMSTEVVDDAGRPVRGHKGYLVCTRPAPSMTRGIWGDPDRYLETYWSRWPGYWYHGDWASVDEDGCWFLHGRADESMNVAGRKVGPAEVEDALIEHPAVSEAAVIGVPDELKGEAIVAFVVAKPSAAIQADLERLLSAHLVESLGPTFKPRAIRVVHELPKTQSGKIVRRLLRQKFLGEALGDLSTVENPHAIEEI